MIGLVVVTHSHLARELLAATEMIIGPVPRAEAVSLFRDQSVDLCRDQLAAALANAGADGEGVLIMADMFGGTPANLSLSFLEEEAIEVLCGVNLPMLIKFFNSREGMTLEELATLLKAYGQQGIVVASEFLRQ
ncbi:MAG: PTS sugar transporter [Desulfuromonas sp.]|nr:MAG: PTS sugar transporter [Desulfuromonas sp.]